MSGEVTITVLNMRGGEKEMSKTVRLNGQDVAISCVPGKKSVYLRFPMGITVRGSILDFNNGEFLGLPGFKGQDKKFIPSVFINGTFDERQAFQEAVIKGYHELQNDVTAQ